MKILRLTNLFSRKSRLKLRVASALALIFVANCSEDKDEPKAGDHYLYIPYLLGDPSKIEGGSETVKFNFTGKASAASSLTTPSEYLPQPRAFGQNLRGAGSGFGSRSVLDGSFNWQAYNHGLRTLLNRFDPQLGFHQGEWFWNLAKSLDQALIQEAMRAASTGSGSSWGANLTAEFLSDYALSEDKMGPIEASYRASLGLPLTSAARAFLSDSGHDVSSAETATAPLPTMNLAAGTCPKAGETVAMPVPSNPSTLTTATIPAGGAVEGADYCIVYLSTLVSETSRDNVKKSLETILSVYKKVVYKDEFATTSGGFVFKPIVVVVDFKNEALWPSSVKYQVDGAYLPVLTASVKQPMIYMPSDLNKVKDRDAALAKKQFHSTLAHEMQHAIIAYYRVYKTAGTLENPSIDEGIAHYMEDLFGFGEENFGGFPKVYLGVFADSFPPALHASEAEAINRGGAQSLIYYLVSQKGGVKFDGGTASGGDGLKYIAEVVSNPKGKGPKGLSDKFGSDWLETVGNFFAAVAVDNTTAPDISDKHKVQEVVAMKDLLGNAKKYGMRFNNFGGLEAMRAFSDAKFVEGTPTDDVTFYSAVPLFREITDPEEVITFTSNSDAGKVGSVRVRIK